MVGDANNVMAKIGSLLHNLLHLADRIHGTELAVHMKFYPFNRGIIGFNGLFGKINVPGIKHHFLGILIVIDLAFNQIPAAFFYTFDDFFFVGKDFAGNAVGIIRDIKGQQRFIVFQRPGVDTKNPAFYDQTFSFGFPIDIKIHIFEPFPGMGYLFPGDHIPGFFGFGKLSRAGSIR
jgi:hypothetical protein